MEENRRFFCEGTEILYVHGTKTVDLQQKSQKVCEVIVKIRLRWTIESAHSYHIISYIMNLRNIGSKTGKTDKIL